MNDEAIITTHAFSTYLYLTSPMQFARDVFGEAHPDYLREYADLFHESKQLAMGKLDFGNFSKVIALALERHGEHSRKWLEANKAHCE